MLIVLSILCLSLFLSISIPLSQPFSYENPVLSSHIDSPFVPTVTFDLEEKDYLLALSNSAAHDFAIQLLHSYSLIDWIHLGWAVGEVPGAWKMDSSSLNGVRMWRTMYNGTSIMILVFSAVHKSDGKHCIGCGFTKGEQLTSFIIQDIPLYCSGQNSDLFPALYQHNASSHLDLVWSEWNETASYILSCDLILLRGHLQLNDTPKALLLKSTDTNLSAPYLFYHHSPNPYYYLFYTSNVGQSSTIHAARSKLKTGPFDSQGGPIISSDPSTHSWHSPCYSSLVKTDSGVFVMLYRASKFIPGLNKNHSFLLLDQLQYTDSHGFRLAPVCGMGPDYSHPSSCRHDIP